MAMDDDQVAEGLAAGFTKKQMEWIDDYFADYGHSHEIEDIEGLPEALGEEVE